MLDSARELFVTPGYAATTMEQIATDAGVAVQTLYYTFKTKGALLCEVVEVTAAGDLDPVPVIERPWWQEVMATRSAQRVLALVVEHGTGIYERVAPLWPALGAASAADPQVEEYVRGVTEARRAGQRAIVAHLAELGALRPELDVDRATDVVVVLAGHDVHRGLVVDARWPMIEYKVWLFECLAQQLLGRKPDRRATADLSFADP